MPNQIRGKILQIGATQTFTTKRGSDFSKREFVQDCTTYDTYTGEPRQNFPSFTLVSKHVSDIDAYKVGDDVMVSFFISRRSYEKEGVTKYINDIVAYKIEPVGNQSSQPPQPTAQPQSTQTASQQTTEAPPFPQGSNGMPTDDLPF